MSTKRSTIIDLAHPHVVSDVKLIMRRVLCHDDDCDVSDDMMCLSGLPAVLLLPLLLMSKIAVPR